MHRKPYTKKEISEQLKAWRKQEPLRLSSDGNLYVIFIEHGGAVETIDSFLGGKINIFSSEGQIRHEHTRAFFSEVQKQLAELRGMELKVVGIADHDSHGRWILNSHKQWLVEQFNCGWETYGITAEQIRAVGLNPEDDHQFEGWLALYTPKRFTSDLKRICHIV